MNDTRLDRCLETICRFANREFRQNKSSFQIYEEANYKNYYKELTIEKIVERIRKDESIIDEWIDFSADKRCTPSWAFMHNNEQWELRYIGVDGVPLYQLTYENRISACAHMIKLEMEALRIMDLHKR